MDRCETCDSPVQKIHCCTCNGCKVNAPVVIAPVDNHILAYCQSFLHNFDVATVANSLDRFFAENELQDARKLLKQTFEDKLVGLEISKNASRKTTLYRSASVAISSDIAEAVYKLMKDDDPPVFITHELHRLPVASPDMAEEKNLMMRLTLLEKKLLKMEEWKVHNDEVLQSHESKFADIERKDSLEWPALRKTNSSVAQERNAWRMHPASIAMASEPSEPQPSSSESTLHVEGSLSGNWERQPHQKRLDNRNAKRNEKQNNQRRRPPGIQGKATGTQFKTGTGPNRDLWIQNVDKDMEDDTFRQFVEEGGSKKSGKVDIRLLQAHDEEYWTTKSYRLTIGLADFDRVFNEEFWPKNIWVRKYWVNFGKGKQTNKSDASASAEQQTDT